MDGSTLQQFLPVFKGMRNIIKDQQNVKDIMKEVIAAHKAFAADYDLIAHYFVRDNIKDICTNLFRFCKNEIPYKIESENRQTTRNPSAIMAMRWLYGGDCKHYAGFIGGIVDAIDRNVRSIDWTYRFASYSMLNSTPGHVFVVVYKNGKEIWIDPVLDSFDMREPEPQYYQDKKPVMSLERITGVLPTSGFYSSVTVNRGRQVGLMEKTDYAIDDRISPVDDLPPEAQIPETQVITLEAPLEPPPPPMNVWVDPMPFLRIGAYNTWQLGITYAIAVFKNQNLPPGAWQILPNNFPISFSVAGAPWPLATGISKLGDPVEPLPPALQVGFAPSFMGIPIPEDMPRPLVVDGKLRIWPLEFQGGNTNAKLVANNKLLLNLLMSSMGALINSYSPAPYAMDFAKLSHYILDLRDKDDFLYPVQTKTFFGMLLQGAADALKYVVRGIAIFHGFGPRLAFFGLVKTNAFAFAYKLFLAWNDPERSKDLQEAWYKLGGNPADLRDAIMLGCLQNPVFGGGVKEWIKDAVRDNIIDNGYTRPITDAEGIPEGTTVPPNTAVGVIGVDDVIEYLAAAGLVIAALAKFLKGIGGPKTDKVVDDVVNAVDVILAVAGKDPIDLANETGKPVKWVDDEGVEHITYPDKPTTNKFTQFIQDNPALAVGVGAVAIWGIYELTRPKRRR